MKRAVLFAILVFAALASAQPFHEGKYIIAPVPPIA